ncbi:MAG: DNA-binding response regulator [Rhodospirillaceae bacterium]|nr:DNA-binding response regulator [Rhodospirillaceae bacterium]|tara:strand:+ start:1684 stop:2364 length:681 start_codon:yes stop_codon:yes gene_type:complete
MRQLLLVENDSNFNSSLKEQLEVDGAFEVELAIGLVAAARIADEIKPNLILINIETLVADLGGKFTTLKKTCGYAPILGLVHYGVNLEVMEELVSIFDDIVLKPVKIGELLKRIDSQFFEGDKSTAEEYEFGPYNFRPTEKLLIGIDNDNHVRLTEKETAILEELYHANGNIVARKDLLSRVWGYSEEISSHTLETHMYRLRKKMEKNPAEAVILITTGGGYRLVL